MITEIWRDVPGYEGLYKISNYGRIKALTKLQGYIMRSERILNPRLIKGYYVAHLCKNGIAKNILVHRIVAECFIDNPDSLPVVNHIDGNKQNNNVNNLEWVTYSENTKHAFKLGLATAPKYWSGKRGKDHCSSKPVKCTETGEVFNSIAEAQEKYKTTHISGVLHGNRKTAAGHTWEWVI